MIAVAGYTKTGFDYMNVTPTDQTAVSEFHLNENYYSSYTIISRCDDLIDYHYIDESLNALSLRRLRELMFVPRKIQLSPIYNKKPSKTSIRNNLPQRIRVNEKPEI